ncbi:MAG TPA: MauE/DoxX family redox-associated membrane protein [Verrucomicrobiae bacterium]|nr:MauE/DoxX family redox-associated membrane protein [Verrucomicrobiae bacterium]
MNSCRKTRSRAVVDSFTVLARWLVGGVFLYMGMSKALDPVDFLKLLRQYDLTQSSLILNSLASALPWFEVFCGLLLVAGIAVRGTALTILAMLLPFTWVVLHRALQIESVLKIPFCAVKFDCGCGTGEEFICRKLLENFLLMALAGWLLMGRGRQFSLRFSLFKPPS